MELLYDHADFFTVQDYADVSVTVLAGSLREPPAIAGLSRNGDGDLLVTLRGCEGREALLAAAFYDGGRMVAVLTRELESGETALTLSVPEEARGLPCRVFLLTQGSFAPLAENRELG